MADTRNVPPPHAESASGFDSDRLEELRLELGEDGLASVLTTLSRDLVATLNFLQGGYKGPETEAMLPRAAHRWVGTLAQFGLTGLAETIRTGCAPGRDAESTVCALMAALRHACGLVADQARQLAVNHGAKDFPGLAAPPPSG